jgi:hypothetical protein
MRKLFIAAALLVPVAAVLGLGGCLLEDREVEIVLNEEHCLEFEEFHTSENYTTPDTLEIGEELDSLLVDNGISKDQILDAFLVSAHYEIRECALTDNWELEGAITIERDDISDGPDTLITYTELIVAPETVGDKVQGVLNAEGVGILNRAIDDYLAGGSPVLILTVVSGDVEPSPSEENPLEFTWEACLYMQVIYMLETDSFEPL